MRIIWAELLGDRDGFVGQSYLFSRERITSRTARKVDKLFAPCDLNVRYSWLTQIPAQALRVSVVWARYGRDLLSYRSTNPRPAGTLSLQTCPDMNASYRKVLPSLMPEPCPGGASCTSRHVMYARSCPPSAQNKG